MKLSLHHLFSHIKSVIFKLIIIVMVAAMVLCMNLNCDIILDHNNGGLILLQCVFFSNFY